MTQIRVFYLPLSAIVNLLLLAPTITAFSSPSSSAQGLISIDERTQRDVFTMEEWAMNCGVQRCEGFELSSFDQMDFSVKTNQDIPMGSPILAVPNEMILSSYKSMQEIGYDAAASSALAEAESMLSEAQLDHLRPLFRLFVKIVMEYERGETSPWFPWLNSLPRLYNTGASMTYACFDCLPPYAAGLALAERVQSVNFQKAAKCLAPSILSDDAATNRDLLKWAYNVAVTRSMEWNGERLIAPMADMFNHGTEVEVQLSYDDEGNCMAYACQDINAGSPLRISLGDPTNPSTLFATYGFLDESSPATFCKLMHMQDEMKALGYDFSNLLFYKGSGEVSMEVYDVVLYSILLKNDPNLAQGFYQAVTTGDEDTQNQYHEQYFAYTKEELLKHVEGTLKKLDEWSSKARSYDIRTHPRVPVILQHNGFVKDTFTKVKNNLNNM